MEYNRWRGRKAGLVYAVAAVVLTHMHASLFLVFGPSMKSPWDDDAALYIGASSLIVHRNQCKGVEVREEVLVC
jgi:hypothetical protein